MRKVIHYIRGSYLPTTTNWIYNQIRYLERYEPVVYSNDVENLQTFPVKNLRSLNFKKSSISLLKILNKLWFETFHYYPTFLLSMFKDRPDVIHAHFGPSGYFFWRIKKFFNIPMITTFYGYDLSRLPVKRPRWKKRYVKLFNNCERFLVEGSHMKKKLAELGCPLEKIIVQHLGVNLEKIKFMPRKINENGSVKIFTCGRFREKKGLPYAVESLGIVKKRNPGLKIKLTILGDSCGLSHEEKEKSKILEMIDNYRLNDSVVLLGEKNYSEFLNELYENHIYMAPSVTSMDGDTEGGLPVSLIEASASGMPVISTAHCDIPEAIIDGKTGFIVPERDVNKLAEKLEFLTVNANLWEKMGIEGRKHIEKYYDAKKQSFTLEKIYDEVIENYKKVRNSC